MSLVRLPNEIVLDIAQYLDARSLNALLRSCQHLTLLLSPLLYNLALEDHDGVPPLIVAAERGYEFLARVLLQRGVEVDPRVLRYQYERGLRAGYELVTPLRQAVVFRHEPVVELLLSNGADVVIPSAPSSPRKTLLHLAVGSGSETITRLVLEHGAGIIDIDMVRKSTSETALHRAARDGQTRIVELLLEWGADATVRNRWGDTALGGAVRYGCVEVVRILSEHGSGRFGRRVAG